MKLFRVTALLITAITCISSGTVLADQKPYPTFAQYSVTSKFQGKPAPARPTTKRAKLFRTVIRNGAEKGPNFAGHYTIVFWGCGTACITLAIVDAASGEVYDTPFRYTSMFPPFPASENIDINSEGYGEFKFHLESRLLILGGCLEEDENQCGVHYYEWNDNTLRLITVKPPTPVKRKQQ